MIGSGGLTMSARIWGAAGVGGVAVGGGSASTHAATAAATEAMQPIENVMRAVRVILTRS